MMAIRRSVAARAMIMWWRAMPAARTTMQSTVKWTGSDRTSNDRAATMPRASSVTVTANMARSLALESRRHTAINGGRTCRFAEWCGHEWRQSRHSLQR